MTLKETKTNKTAKENISKNGKRGWWKGHLKVLLNVNKYLEENSVPEKWHNANYILIYKKKKHSGHLENYGPILKINKQNEWPLTGRADWCSEEL